MSPFSAKFPELATRETRVFILPYPQGGLPAGHYGFLELYCVEPACDCRRVLLEVRTEKDMETVLATINYGWESVAFCTQWLHGGEASARECVEGFLHPLNPQSKLAPALLRLFRAVVLQDRAYVERLKRHYGLFKKAGGGRAGMDVASE